MIYCGCIGRNFKEEYFIGYTLDLYMNFPVPVNVYFQPPLTFLSHGPPTIHYSIFSVHLL